MAFEIVKTTGVIEWAKIVPSGRGQDRPVETKFSITIDVDCDHDDANAHDGSDALFPSYAFMASRLGEMSDLHEGHPGVKINSMRKVPRLTFVVGDEGGDVWRFPNSKVTTQPKMLIDTEGSCTIAVEVITMMTDDQMSQLRGYIGREVRVSCHETQEDLFSTQATVRHSSRQMAIDHGMTGHELRSMREARGLSRPALAELLSVSRKSIQRYEMGERVMPAHVAHAATEALTAMPKLGGSIEIASVDGDAADP